MRRAAGKPESGPGEGSQTPRGDDPPEGSKRRRAAVLYPFLIALYPALALYAPNAVETPISELAWPVVLMTAAAGVVWGLLRLTTRDPARAGLWTLLALAVFDTVEPAPEWVAGWLRYLSGFWVEQDIQASPGLTIAAELAAAAVLAGIVSRMKNPGKWTAGLNLFAAILIAFPLITIVHTAATEPARVRPPATPAVAAFSGPGAPGEALRVAARDRRLPDIYYIILDGYARTDVLRARFGFDNEPFLERLARQGFYVARQSTANYCQTPLCLSSALNMTYLNGLIPAGSHDKAQLRQWIGDGVAVRTLRSLGYRFVSFATGFAETEQPEADRYLAPTPALSPFHQMLVARTPLARLLGPGIRDDYVQTRERTLFLLKTLPQVARWKEPTFTFAHILAPHAPFVFGEEGEDVSPHERFYYLTDGELFRGYYGNSEAYAAGYRKQASFLTRQVETMIDGILANSPEPPVIILQSDHGSGMGLSTRSAADTDLHERMSILNAYYFPGSAGGALYQGISPVNSFRVLFNAYFQANLGLLPDRCYFSTWDDPFQFLDVTERVRPASASPGEGIGPPALPGPP